MSTQWPAVLPLVVLLVTLQYGGQSARPRPGAGRCAIPRLQDGRARPRQAGQLVRFTCAPGFQLVGSRYASCRAARWDVDPPVCVKPGCQPVKVKNAIQIELHGGAWMLFFCTSGHENDGPAAIYCNGRTWNGTAPDCEASSSASPQPLSCDFEGGLCGWAQDELHDFDWKRWSGRTPSAFMFTGPSHDHTHGPDGTGSYVYLEATSRLENDTARLLSPVYRAELARDGCFSFFYHMFGKSTGGLRVYQKPASEELQALLALGGAARRPYVLFERWGDQGDAWYGAVANLTDFHEDFQIVVEGVRGASFTSDIAVDDVALLQGARCGAARALAPSPAPYDVESCSGRCEGAAGAAGAGRRVGACGCGAACLAADDCCPDYFELCGFAVTDASSERSAPSEGDVEGGGLPDKQPLVASTAAASTAPSVATSTAPSVTTSTATSAATSTATSAATSVAGDTAPAASTAPHSGSPTTTTTTTHSASPASPASPAVPRSPTTSTGNVTSAAKAAASAAAAAASTTKQPTGNATPPRVPTSAARRPPGGRPTPHASTRRTPPNPASTPPAPTHGGVTTQHPLPQKNSLHRSTQPAKSKGGGGAALSGAARAALAALAVPRAAPPRSALPHFQP